jgi:hypothetical protein
MGTNEEYKKKKATNEKLDFIEEEIQEIKSTTSEINTIVKSGENNRSIFLAQAFGFLILFIAWIAQNTYQAEWESRKAEYESYETGVSSFGILREIADFEVMNFRVHQKIEPNTGSGLESTGAYTQSLFNYAYWTNMEMFSNDSFARTIGYDGPDEYTYDMYDQKANEIKIHWNAYWANKTGINLLPLEHDATHLKNIYLGPNHTNLRDFLGNKRSYFTLNANSARMTFLILYIEGSILLGIAFILKHKDKLRIKPK